MIFQPQQIESLEKVSTNTGAADWSERLLDGSGVSREAPVPFCERRGVRFPWSTRHRVHYVKEVTLQEDASHIPRNPGVFARLRSFALNILHKNKEISISLALFDNALNLDRVLPYQGVLQ